MKRVLLFCALLMRVLTAAMSAEPPAVIVAEGEQFTSKDKAGWKVIDQDQSLASHTYGGMWTSHGGLLSAAADSSGSTAVLNVKIPEAGDYRVWSKYQAPPYFNYMHRIEVWQNGKKVYHADYGRTGTDRLWSFSGKSNELFWSWGIDHDCAEAPQTMAKLAAGAAEIRIITIDNPKPAGARMIDFVVLTTSPDDGYVGHKPYRVGSPFTNEAFAATKFYMRFKGAGDNGLTISRRGHYQPNYGGAKLKLQGGTDGWSKWQNIGPFCRWVHDEGIWFDSGGSQQVQVQFALDESGKKQVGDMTLKSGEVAVIPMDITWRAGSRVKTNTEHAMGVIKASKTWRRANGGKKPKNILFYGAFNGNYPWLYDLKDTLGYNTLLPDKYDHAEIDGYHQHCPNEKSIKAYAAKLGPKKANFRVMSFGDEIHLGKINYKDPGNIAGFRAWLKKKGVTARDIGVDIEKAVLTETEPRQAWYTRLFNGEEKFKYYRHLTAVTRQAIGPQVLTGANFSPHYPVPAYYGPIYQWIDTFKHNGMSMFWSEDYIFSMADVPQVISWQFAQIRCAVKYNNQPIHFYVMPHAPGQTPGNFRRNNLLAIGSGARHIDHFWVAPAEEFTENYVAWRWVDQFRAIQESIFDTAEAEIVVTEAKVRPAQVAVLIGKATDFNEMATKIPKEKDPFARLCKNAPEKITQQICRREATLLYLGLRHTQYAVDVITEDDVIELDTLKKYKVVYFAGEWINTQTIPKIESWVKSGGVFYATAGCGYRNQFNQPEPAMLKLLGLKAITCQKDNYLLRTLLELVLARPIDQIGEKDPVSAVGMRQVLTPDTARAIGDWSRGGAAVTVRQLGKGKIYAVGTLPGHSYFKTALKVVPYGRGGRMQPYSPTKFGRAEQVLLSAGLDDAKLTLQAECSVSGVESLLLDNDKGTCLTLVNWTNAPVEEVKVMVRSSFKPRKVRSVEQQKDRDFQYADGAVTFTTSVNEADYFLILR